MKSAGQFQYILSPEQLTPEQALDRLQPKLASLVDAADDGAPLLMRITVELEEHHA